MAGLCACITDFVGRGTEHAIASPVEDTARPGRVHPGSVLKGLLVRAPDVGEDGIGDICGVGEPAKMDLLCIEKPH